MKTSKRIKNNRDLQYPCLMTNEAETKMVLMTSYGEGFLVHDENEDPEQRHFYKGWAMDCFKIYDGEIILSN